jgi:hypothetical protein
VVSFKVMLTPLCRHPDGAQVLDVYAQALTPAKRAAQHKVVLMIRERISLYRECTAGNLGHRHKLLIRLASPTGFEPVLIQLRPLIPQDLETARQSIQEQKRAVLRRNAAKESSAVGANV